MCKVNKKSGDTRIDPCMKTTLYVLKSIIDDKKVEICACCCGHKKYPMTIIVKTYWSECFDLVSGVQIPRKVRFYKRDKSNIYYIPECVK